MLLRTLVHFTTILLRGACYEGGVVLHAVGASTGRSMGEGRCSIFVLRIYFECDHRHFLKTPFVETEAPEGLKEKIRTERRRIVANSKSRFGLLAWGRRINKAWELPHDY